MPTDDGRPPLPEHHPAVAAARRRNVYPGNPLGSPAVIRQLSEHAAMTLIRLQAHAADDPVLTELLSQAWGIGWTTGWDDRSHTGPEPMITPNPFR